METFGYCSNKLTRSVIFFLFIYDPVGLFGLFIIIKLVLSEINSFNCSVLISKLSFSESFNGTAFAPLYLIIDL